MNYYPFHIGDYAAHTQRLSLIEDLAYRRMIDAYYLVEDVFKGSSAEIAREIGMRDYIEEVEYVLSKFFVKTTAGFANTRCDEEIARYHNKQEKASNAGKASAERRLKQSPTDVEVSPTDVQLTNNQEPITNNQEETIQTYVEHVGSTSVDNVVIKERKKRKKSNVDDFDWAGALHHNGVSEQHISEWLKVRRMKGGVNTQTAFNAFLKNVSESGMEVDDAVQICIVRSWAGFNPDWLRPKSHDRPEKFDPTAYVNQNRRDQ